MRISPELALSKPAMMRSRVVLPEPLSPRMVRNSPSATCSEMSRSTAVLPNDLARFRISSNGAVDDVPALLVAGSMMVAKVVLVTPASRRLSGRHPALRSGGGTPPSQPAGCRRYSASVLTVPLLLHSRFRCTWRGAAHFARNKDAPDSYPRRRDAVP